MVAMDLSIVDRRYFSLDNYQRKRTAHFTPTAADEEILKDKSNYRVYSLQESFSQEARTSYYHNSLGGYHGAKIRRYQDLYDSCLSRETNEFINDAQTGGLQFGNYGVLNMLNTKYIVFGPDKSNMIRNPAANGSAWFVEEVVKVNSASEELEKICEINTRNSAVIDISKFEIQNFQYDSASTIQLKELTPKRIVYESVAASNGLAVFSEIYYPKGWQAMIDGKEVPIIRADYVLRALEVPSGKHEIVFEFKPKAYIIGNKITMASSWLLLLVVAGSLGLTFRKK